MSEIRATTISDAAGTGPITLTGQSAAKAWVNFNQATPAILDSFNTSSLTDTSMGKGDLNWSSAMGNTTYASSGAASSASSGTYYSSTIMDDTDASPRTASKWYFQQGYANASAATWGDFVSASVSIHGDLA